MEGMGDIGLARFTDLACVLGVGVAEGLPDALQIGAPVVLPHLFHQAFKLI